MSNERRSPSERADKHEEKVRDTLARVGRDKAQHFERISDGKIRMTPEQAANTVRENWLTDHKKRGVDA